MATLYLDAVDFSCIPAKRFAVPVVDVDPQGYDGGLIWNSTEQVLKHYDGSDWAVVGSEGAGGPQYALLSDVDDRFAKVALWVGDPTPLHVNSTLSEWLSDLADEVHHLSARPAFSLDGILHVDLYNGFARAFSNTPELEIGGEKWVEFELATTPAPGGTIPPGANAIASSAGTLVRAGGTQGPVVGETGGAVSQMALANYISQNRICRVLYDLSNPVRPTLTILETLDAIPTGTSALHLGALYDVSAPANTPAGKVLGTVAEGSWGPVDPPAGGGGDYLPLTGGALTGNLELPSLSGKVSPLSVVWSMQARQSSTLAASFTMPPVYAGDMIILGTMLASSTEANHGITNAADIGFTRFPSVAGPHIGFLNNNKSGHTFYYKMALGNESGTLVPLAWPVTSEKMYYVIVVRGATDPAVSAPLFKTSASYHYQAAGTASLGYPGLMIAVFGGLSLSTNQLPPTTTWGNVLFSTGAIPAVEMYGLATYSLVDAGPSPAVDVVYPSGEPFAWSNGLIHIPATSAGARVELGSALSVNGYPLLGLPSPTAPNEAANKAYVDGKMIVLGPTDPVPGGTAAGTVIVRKGV